MQDAVLEVGILGFGTIGKGVASRAAGLGMRVVAVDSHAQQKPPYVAWIGRARLWRTRAPC